MNTRVITINLEFVNGYLLRDDGEHLLAATGMPRQGEASSEGPKSDGCDLGDGKSFSGDRLSELSV